MIDLSRYILLTGPAEFVYVVVPLDSEYLEIVRLTCCAVKPCIELIAVVEYTFELPARRLAVLKVHLSHVPAAHGMDGHAVIFMASLETPHIIYVIADALHALIKKPGFFALQHR